jgi:hypothetical protein
MKNFKEFQKMLKMIKIRKIIKNQSKDKRKVSAKEIIILDEMILFKLRKNYPLKLFLLFMDLIMLN